MYSYKQTINYLHFLLIDKKDIQYNIVTVINYIILNINISLLSI